MKYLRFLGAIGAAIAFAGILAGTASADQSGTNTVLSFQGGFAYSGNAGAGLGFASSGDAEVENELEVEQSVKQASIGCGCDQWGDNFVGSEQLGEAASGEAGAFLGIARTGDAEVENEVEVEQRIKQFNISFGGND
jgi:hypothetical protein